MGKKRESMGTGPEYAELLQRVADLEKKMNGMRKKQASEAALLRKGRMQEGQDLHLDEVICTNVYGDTHRLLTDRIDLDFSAPLSSNESEPAEISRRATLLVLKTVATNVAIEWRDFSPQAGQWDELSPQDARKKMIQELRSDIAQDFPADYGTSFTMAESQVIGELVDEYASRVDVVKRLSADDLQTAVTEGIMTGRRVLSVIFDELEADHHSQKIPLSAKHNNDAVVDGWDIVARRIRQHVPEDTEFSRKPDERFGQCCLLVAQDMLTTAFNLAANGDGSRTGQRFMFAGSILTQMNMPQTYIETLPSLNGAEQAHGEGVADDAVELLPAPKSGELAETPQTVQMREMMLVCQLIAESLDTGPLRSAAWQVFNQQSGTSARTMARKGLKPEDMDAGPAAIMMREILGDMTVEIRKGDGHQLGDTDSLNWKDKLTIAAPWPVHQVIPSVRTLQ